VPADLAPTPAAVIDGVSATTGPAGRASSVAITTGH
jgi:hypothetical protein